MFSKLSNEAWQSVLWSRLLVRRRWEGGVSPGEEARPGQQSLTRSLSFETLLSEFSWSDIILSKHSKRALHTRCCQGPSFFSSPWRRELTAILILKCTQLLKSLMFYLSGERNSWNKNIPNKCPNLLCKQ